MTRTRPIRVLWAIKQLGPGGSERLLGSAAPRHDRQAFAIDAVYLMRGNDELAPQLRAEGVDVTCLDVASAFDPRWLTRLRALLDRGDYDVLHVHSPLIAGFSRPLLASLPPGRRPGLVITEHGAWHHYRPLTRLLNVVTRPVGDAHMAVSEAARDSLPWWLRRRTGVVVHGIPVDELTPLRDDREVVRSELGIPDGDVLVMTVANLRPEKDYPTLLAAAEQVVAARGNVRFVVVGGGELDASLRAEQRRTALGFRFQFLGFRTDATRLMAAADIFVLASQEEGGPLTVVEAMALGLPIIATRVGGVPRAVRDGVEGLIVPVGRADVLAGAVIRLVDDGALRARLGAAALTRSREYDITHTVGVIEDLYTRVARAGGARADHRQWGATLARVSPSDSGWHPGWGPADPT